LQKKKFFTKLKTSHEQILGVFRLANHLGVSQFVAWLRVQNTAQKIRQNRSILNRVRLSCPRGAEACIANNGIVSNFFDVSFYALTHNYSVFTLLFKPLLFSETIVSTILSSLDKFYQRLMIKLKQI
jgi:hypothetical protein